MATRKSAAPPRPRKAKPKEPPMTVVLRDVPPGYNWGWFSREDQRMHLQTVDKEHRNLYKVWLEAKGKRVFEPVGQIPAAVLKKLKAEVARRRAPVEAEWIHFMMKQGWLEHQVNGTTVTLTAYPRVAGKIERAFELVDHLGPDWAAEVRPEDVNQNLEFAVIELFPNQPESRRPFIDIARILWQE